MLERWQYFLETYVSYTQPSTLDFPLSEQLKSCITFPNYVNPNASNKMEYFIGHGENISYEKIPKIFHFLTRTLIVEVELFLWSI